MLNVGRMAGFSALSEPLGHSSVAEGNHTVRRLTQFDLVLFLFRPGQIVVEGVQIPVPLATDKPQEPFVYGGYKIAERMNGSAPNQEPSHATLPFVCRTLR